MRIPKPAVNNGATNRSFNVSIPQFRWDETFNRDEHLRTIDHDAFCDGCEDCNPPEEVRVEQPHECDNCGKKMRYADQQCGCTAVDPWLR